MRLGIINLLLCVAFSLTAQENLKVVTYNLAGSEAKDMEAFQEWAKEQAIDILALQEAQLYAEDISKIAKKWKHKHSVSIAQDGKQFILTSRYPLKTVSSTLDGAIKVKVKDIDFYVVQLNQDSLTHRLESAEAITADIKQANEKTILLGHLEGYAKADSSIYAKRYREVANEDRANRDIIRQISSYSRSANYDLMKLFDAAGLQDKISERGEKEEVEGTFPSQKMGTFQPYQLYRTDYILLSENLVKQASEQQIMKDRFTHRFSNHYPVMIVINGEE